MKEFNKNTIGLITGTFFAVTLILWSIIVALGLGQNLLDFIFSIHFLNNPFTVENFELTKAVILIVVTFVVGYIVGFISTVIWNRLIKKR